MAETRGRHRIFKLIRPHIVAAAAFSVALNVLFLVSPLYMLQVYDRVLTTGSIETLILLSVIAIFLLGIYLFAEAGRRRVLARAAQVLNDELAEPALKQGFADPAASAAKTVGVVGSLNTVQQAFTQALPATLFDVPFVPLFLAVLFMVHPVLGAIGLVGAILLLLLAVINERMTKTPLGEAQTAERAASQELSQLVRQKGAIAGMGMANRAVSRWSFLRQRGVAQSLEAGTPATFFGAGTRSLRMILQVAILGGGAFFAVQGLVSPGAIIASSIIMGRALAPIDQAVNSWRPMMGAWGAFKEVADWVGSDDGPSAPVTPMPRPEPQLTLEELQVTVPGADKPLLAPIEHVFERGRIVTLLGRSGSGKTSLLQTIAGAWQPLAGTVRLGQRDMWRWEAGDRGQYVGYLPQHVELLRGTVRENICRFTDAPVEDIFEAAKFVGADEMILALPDGYDTKIGEQGQFLSAGQRQAIGLARAFFRMPPLIVLDEPTAHLDSSLAQSLLNLIAKASRLSPTERQFTAILATHDMRLINAADDVMIMKDRQAHVTERAAYMNKISQLRAKQAAPTVKEAAPATAAQPLTVDIKNRGPENG